MLIHVNYLTKTPLKLKFQNIKLKEKKTTGLRKTIIQSISQKPLFLKKFTKAAWRILPQILGLKYYTLLVPQCT